MYNLSKLPNVNVACNEHFNFFKHYVEYKMKIVTNKLPVYAGIIEDRNFTKSHVFARPAYNLIKNFIVLFSIKYKIQNLEIVLKGSPQQLLEVNDDFIDYVLKSSFLNKEGKTYTIKDYYGADNWKVLKIELGLIFSYKHFKSLQPTDVYNSYLLAELLGMRACTYCNRDFILVKTDSKRGKLLCPQYDHWFPQDKFPLLQVSFYNLIPSCGSCNSSVKGNDVLLLDKYCHPYDFGKDSFYYSYLPVRDKRRYKILVDSKEIVNSKILRTIRKLKIDQMYNGHIPELEDLIDLKEAYGDNYLLTLTKSFPKLGAFTTSEVYRMHFGTEKDEVDFYKKPMSKFKKDILKKLKLIDESY